MLQDFGESKMPEGTLGVDVSISFQCKDALAIHREVTSRGVQAKRPFVGNAMWVTILSDLDGYKIEFQKSKLMSPRRYSTRTSDMRGAGHRGLWPALADHRNRSSAPRGTRESEFQPRRNPGSHPA